MRVVQHLNDHFSLFRLTIYSLPFSFLKSHNREKVLCLLLGRADERTRVMWRHRVGLAVHCQVVCVCVFIVGYLTRDWWENIPLFYFIFLKDIKSLPSLLAPAVVVHLPRSGEPCRFLRHSSSSVRENVASSCRLGHERLRQKWKRVVRVAYMRWDQLMLDPSNLSSKSHRLFVFFFSNQTGKKDETKLYFGYFHLIIIYRRPSSNAAGRCRLSSDPVNRRCAHKLLKKRRRRRRRCDVRTCVRVSNATPALALMALAASSRSLENCPRGKTSNCKCRQSVSRSPRFIIYFRKFIG